MIGSDEWLESVYIEYGLSSSSAGKSWSSTKFDLFELCSCLGGLEKFYVGLE